MQLVADVGGIPGRDCNGFCKYCYFRKVKEVKSFGCAHCLPNKIGCERCSKGVSETQGDFKSPFEVMNEVQTAMMMRMGHQGEISAYISGGGDISCYPHLESLTANLNQFSISSVLGYTCGKGITDSDMATRLINNGVKEVSFTIFSSNPKLRKEWVKDPNPTEALKARETCNSLEEWGAKGMLLMRFANTFNEGLILGNEPIIKGLESQPVEEFGELVKQINSEYKFRVSGTPICDPETGGPFAIAKDENEVFLQFIKPITGEATVITSKIAEPYLTKIFSKLETGENVNIVACEKEIACLITKEDLEKLDLSEIKDTVIIPGRSFVHQLDAERILSADGVDRLIGRGPDTLSVDGELSIDMTDENVIERELEEFNDLVDAINFFGMRRI